MSLAALSPAVAVSQDQAGGAQLAVSALSSYTDNFYYQNDPVTSSLGFLLRPEFSYLGRTAKAEVGLAVHAEQGIFDVPGSKDDYTDGAAALQFAVRPTYRNRVALEGGYIHGHDPFGLERTEGSATVDADLDEWDETRGALRYRYGAPAARVNAELGVSTLGKEYQTNRAATEVLDYAATTVEYGMAYNASPKTAAVVSFSRTDIEFDVPFDNNAGPGGTDLDHRSGHVYQARAGVRWLATARTSGDVRVGYRQRTFDELSDDLEGADWQAGIQWAPTPMTLFELRTGRSEQQSYRLDANVIDQQHIALSFRRSLSGKSRLQLSIEQTESDFFGSAREDITHNASLGFELQTQRYLYVVGNATYSTRDSNVLIRDYDRLNAFLGLRLGRGTAR